MYPFNQPASARSHREKSIKNILAVTVALAFAAMSSVAFAGGHGSIADVAKKNGSFGTLLAAAEAAGLVETLNGDGPLTVFAPTDEAFAALPEGTVEDLLKPENKDKLTSILTYHVVPGKVMAADLAGKTTEATTVNGAALSIDATGDAVMIGEATVVTADVDATNGVIHVVDKVLMPAS